MIDTPVAPRYAVQAEANRYSTTHREKEKRKERGKERGRERGREREREREREGGREGDVMYAHSKDMFAST